MPGIVLLVDSIEWNQSGPTPLSMTGFVRVSSIAGLLPERFKPAEFIIEVRNLLTKNRATFEFFKGVQDHLSAEYHFRCTSMDVKEYPNGNRKPEDLTLILRHD
jgi:hypothetical protein